MNTVKDRLKSQDRPKSDLVKDVEDVKTDVKEIKKMIVEMEKKMVKKSEKTGKSEDLEPPQEVKVFVIHSQPLAPLKGLVTGPLSPSSGPMRDTPTLCGAIIAKTG